MRAHGSSIGRLTGLAGTLGLVVMGSLPLNQTAAEPAQTEAHNLGVKRLPSLELEQLKERIMLYTIIGVLLVLWLLGFSMHIGGGLIHALLVIAAIVFLFNLFSGRRSVA
jgi:hypothetical protein